VRRRCLVLSACAVAWFAWSTAACTPSRRWDDTGSLASVVREPSPSAAPARTPAPMKGAQRTGAHRTESTESHGLAAEDLAGAESRPAAAATGLGTEGLPADEPRESAPGRGAPAAGAHGAGTAPPVVNDGKGVGQVLASASKPAADALPELWRQDRGAQEVPLLVPRDESLVYDVRLNLGWLGSPSVGTVTMTSQVRPFFSSIAGAGPGEQVQLSGRALGSYKVYTLDNVISAVLLPQDFPRIVHRNVQTGTENRSRELLFGLQDQKQVTQYRGDGHCKGCDDKAHFVSGSWPWSEDVHCKKCRRGEHRVRKAPKTREVPAGSLDMITAVYLARSLVIDGRQRIEFPLVDRNDLWRVQLTRGPSRVLETEAGRFNVVSIEIRTSAPEGLEGSESDKFEGLFGIHGTISIWCEASSGVPIRIDGTVPAGPVDLDATIELRSASGTPSTFTVLH
jgi:hypothetical protein